MGYKYKMIDCFSGAGGLSYGFSLAGFVPIFAFDNDEACINTYNRNFGEHGFVMEAEDVTKKIIEKYTRSTLEEVAVVVGGPPCQGFSVQRRGEDSDPRNKLVLEFIRLVFEIQPYFFVMENVGGLLSKRGYSYIEDIKELCQKNNYLLKIKKLDTINYGVPQHRKRVILVGQRNVLNRSNDEFEFPNNSEYSNFGYSTVYEAIFDLMDKPLGSIPNHIADKLSKINLERIRSINEGEGRDSLPLHLQLPCHTGNTGHRHLDVYGRMSWNAPGPTITARFDSYSRGRFGHPVLDRTITLREGARLQTFPDTFVFTGSKVQIAKQIGNAVPPLFAKVLADQIIKYLPFNDNNK